MHCLCGSVWLCVSPKNSFFMASLSFEKQLDLGWALSGMEKAFCLLFLTVDYRFSVVWNMLGSEIQSFQYTCEFLVTGGGCETDVGVTGRHQPLSEWGELSLSYPLLLSVWVGLSFFPHDCLNKDVRFILFLFWLCVNGLHIHQPSIACQSVNPFTATLAMLSFENSQ